MLAPAAAVVAFAAISLATPTPWHNARVYSSEMSVSLGVSLEQVECTLVSGSQILLCRNTIVVGTQSGADRRDHGITYAVQFTYGDCRSAVTA
jgi:hypothetical protein